MTTINCDCSTNDFERSDVSEEKIVTARKQHYCCECGDTIEKGEKYQRAACCSDGSWMHYNTCSFCVTLRNKYCSRGYIYTELAETLQECLGFWYPSDPETWSEEPREPARWQLEELKRSKEGLNNVTVLEGSKDAP